MDQINVDLDKDVYEFIKNNAAVYDDKTLSDTLRRLLNIPVKKKSKPKPALPPRRKAPRTDLNRLKDAGILFEGQILHMCDGRGNIIPGANATVSGNGVEYEGKHYSLSELARIFLNKNGYTSYSYRGPAFWYTEDNISIMELWNKFLEESNDS